MAKTISIESLENAKASLLQQQANVMAGLNKIQGAIEMVDAQLKELNTVVDDKKKK